MKDETVVKVAGQKTRDVTGVYNAAGETATSFADDCNEKNEELRSLCVRMQRQLADSTKKIKYLEAERIELKKENTELKKEIDNLNNDVINSFIHEREEIQGLRRREKKESAQKIEELEKRIGYIEGKGAGKKTGHDGINPNTKREVTTGKRNERKQPAETMEQPEAGEKEQIDQKTDQNDGTTLKRTIISTKNTVSADSGIDLLSLTKLIDDRVDARLRNRRESAYKGDSEKEVVQTVYAKDTKSTDQISSYLSSRNLNIIIHRLPEDNVGKDQTIIEELFGVVGLKYSPTVTIDRLGSKSNEKTRPIRLSMGTPKEKADFMSSLGRLKNGPDTFKNISVTDDYTQDERKEILQWVEEANERSKKNEDGYVWES